VVKVKRGEIATGLPALRTELDKIGERIILPRYLLLLGELAVCLGEAGETAQALQAVDKTLERCERNDELWSIAELFRVKGELISLEGGAGAEDQFRRAIDWAQRQGALSWELRAAISLVRSQRGGEQAPEARQLLSQVYNRFSEGFGTADLSEARALMAER
jgi:predicted ATPase